MGISGCSATTKVYSAAPMKLGRKAARGDHSFGVGGVLDPGDDEPFDAHVERLADMSGVVPGDAHEERRGDVPISVEIRGAGVAG